MTRRNAKKGSATQSRQPYKILVEKHADGYVAYPLGLKGVVVGQGDTYEAAVTDVKSAIRFHIDTFGKEVLESDSPVLEAFIAEAEVSG
jgi:predicted RNase H-like HicB family nuclease